MSVVEIIISEQCEQIAAVMVATDRTIVASRIDNRISQMAPLFAPSNTWFVGSVRVCPQTAPRSVHPFCRAHDRDQHTDAKIMLLGL